MVLDFEKMASSSESGIALSNQVVIGLNLAGISGSPSVVGSGSGLATTVGLYNTGAASANPNTQTVLDVFYCYEVICNVLPDGSMNIQT